MGKEVEAEVEDRAEAVDLTGKIQTTLAAKGGKADIMEEGAAVAGAEGTTRGSNDIILITSKECHSTPPAIFNQPHRTTRDTGTNIRTLTPRGATTISIWGDRMVAPTTRKGVETFAPETRNRGKGMEPLRTPLPRR